MDEARLARIEDDVAELKIALEILQSHCATQERMLRVETELPQLQAGFQKLEAELKARLADYHALRDEFWSFRADVKDYPVRAEVNALEQRLGSLHAELGKLRQRVDSEMPYLASKEELQKVFNKSRNWAVGTAITLFFALATIQISMFNVMSNSLNSNLHEAMEGIKAAIAAIPAAPHPQVPRSFAPPDCLRD
jgi:chromosome segregation ATPase